MRNCLTLKFTLLVVLIQGASSLPLDANASDQQIPTRTLESDQVNPGDRITVYQKSGRVLDLVVEKVATTDQSNQSPGVTGTYISDITDKGRQNFRTTKQKQIVISFQQNGEIIEGNVSSLRDSSIRGIRKGDTITFFFNSPVISRYRIKGEWQVSADANRLVGSWSSYNNPNSGQWNLTRLGPTMANGHADAAAITGKLIEDQSTVEIKLADIEKIELPNPQLTETATSKTAQTGAAEQECEISKEASNAIEDARSAWNKAEYTPGVYNLIVLAEAAVKPPECDNYKAIDLAGQAQQLATEYGKSLPPSKITTPTLEPERVNAESPPSRPRSNGFGEFSFSRVAFDDDNLSGSAFLWGVTLGGTVYSHYEIAYSYNDLVPLISPDLDKPAELGTGEYLDVNMQMLSLRRNWQINDTTTAFALVGYSKTRIGIDHLSLCVYCGFSINSKKSYRNKLSGTAWGVGMQWKTKSNGYRSLKYLDHSDSGFSFRGIQLSFGAPF